MDLWDLAKVLLRRWVVAVPLLVLTVGATVWTAVTIEPDYSAVGNMTLLPPTVEQPANPEEARTVNPWDTFQLAGVVLIHANSKTLKDEFEAAGFSGDWEATADERYGTVITVEVTAGSERAARDAMRQLLGIIADEVEVRQNEYDLPAYQRITTVIFDDVFDVTAVTGKVKRAMVVVLGIGLILTVALTVSFDALLRRRARDAGPAAETAAATHAVSGKPPVAGGLSQPIRVRVMSPPASAASPDAASGESRPGESRPGESRPRESKPVRARAAVAVPGEGPAPDRAEQNDRPTGNGSGRWDHSPDDSTVVIPLSGANVSNRDLPRAGRGPEGQPR
jgi:capsular polysaccharide biosynthesis protein